MKSTFYFLIFAVLILVFTNLEAAKYENYETFFKDFSGLELDSKSIMPVNGLFFVKDVASFTLDSGMIYFFKPLNGNIIGAVFEGKGAFNYVPKMKVERKALLSEYETEFVDKQFDYLFMIFSDETFNELTADHKPREGVIPASIIAKIKQSKEYLVNMDYQYIDEDVIDHFIDEKWGGYFFSLISEGRTSPAIFSIKPRLIESVVFAKGDWTTASIGRFYRPLTMEQSLNSPEITDENYDMLLTPKLRILHRSVSHKYESIAMISFVATDTLQLLSNYDKRSWFLFQFSRYLDVKNILFEGREQYYYKSKHIDGFLIKLDRQIKKNDTFKLIINFINDNKEELYAGRQINTSPSQERFNYLQTIELPTKYTLLTDAEVLQADSMKYGRKYIFKGNNIEMSWGGGEQKYKEEQIDEKLKAQIYYYNTESPEKVVTTFKVIYGFYKNLFGELDTNLIRFSKSFGYNSRSTIPFYERRDAKMLDDWHYGFARSIANKWWGGLVRPLSYRDEWITDGLEYYAYMLYITMYLKDTKRYDEEFVYWRDQILNYFNSSKDKIGTLNFGYRDYNKADEILRYKANRTIMDVVNTIVIELKGMMIIHSLRNMLIDTKTNNEDVFFNILKELYKSYKHKRVTTENFKQIIEKHTNMDMTWFFDQWVYGNQIPKYTFGYKVEKTPEGKFKVKCRVKQEKVADGFVMPVLIRVDFGNDQFYPARVVINNKITEFELPLLPLEPKDIKFNFNYSVLCEETTDDYEDIK